MTIGAGFQFLADKYPKPKLKEATRKISIAILTFGSLNLTLKVDKFTL